jgi:peptidoglycan/xylan/chitin deacetylase (PgdA/CDA1 family)
MRKLIPLLFFVTHHVLAEPCSQWVYLTFDTGNMSVAEDVANTLRKHQIKASFFLANEKTKRGDFSLDSSWKNYWSQLKKDGHAFGNHMFRKI